MGYLGIVEHSHELNYHHMYLMITGRLLHIGLLSYQHSLFYWQGIQSSICVCHFRHSWH